MLPWTPADGSCGAPSLRFLCPKSKFCNNPHVHETANEIARRRLIKKANISTSVDRLIKKGYIRRRVDPDDRRFIHLELTGNAEPTVSEIKKIQSDFFSRFTAGLSKEELETYKLLTEKLLFSIKRCTRRADGGSIC